MSNTTQNVAENETKEEGGVNMDNENVEIVEEKKEEQIAVKQPTLTPASLQPSEGYVPTVWNNPELMKASYQTANILSKSDMVPQSYRGKPANCFIAIDMASRMNTSPLLVMGFLNVIQGNAAWNGQGCIALINNCGRFTPLQFEESWNGSISAKDMEFSCVAYATDKKTGTVLKSTVVDKALAESCGWLAKNGSYWLKMPQQMARYRSAAFFARAYCPEALAGLYTTDEIADIKGNYSDETEKTTIKVED